MRQAGDNRHGHRLDALTIVLWRADLRIQEALSLTEAISISVADSIWSDTQTTSAGARSA